MANQPADNKKKETESEKGGSSKKEAEEVAEISHLDEAPKIISKDVLSIIPEEVAKKYRIAFFGRQGSILQAVIVNPQDFEAINVLRFLAEKERMEIEVYNCSPKVFSDIMSRYTSTEKALEDVVKSLGEGGEELESMVVKEEKDEERNVLQEAPIAKLVQVVIRHAIDGKASDVHIEPVENIYRVRFRVDGILHSSLTLPKEVGRAVVSRIKILSNLKIDEKRKPQDGRFSVAESGRKIDFRVSTLPVVEGEKVAMRVLDKEDWVFDLKSLGIVGRNHEILSGKIRDSYGILLMTGPTGSGKTTTLYAFLQILNKEERNIVTLEDPVEYYIEGINQSQIKPEIGYSFANGLRSILRQDPNVIMVGEIRDSETAELSIHAALTGHLVFSTLHTNDAVGSIPRLIDMGLEPFLLSSSLRAVAAQRLVRRICKNCKKESAISDAIKRKVEEALKDIDPAEIKKYGLQSLHQMKFYEGKGCEDCGRQGYKGRIAIYEVLEVTGDVQRVISEKSGGELDLREEAKKQGMITMKQDGLLKVLQGLTSLSEVERVTEGSLTIGGDMGDDRG
jgi:type IV pilus assembly protein PilB